MSKSWSCRKKRRYRDWADAQQALNVIERKSDRDRIPVRSYDCPQCGGWHLSSRPDTLTVPKSRPSRPHWTSEDQAKFERLKIMRGVA